MDTQYFIIRPFGLVLTIVGTICLIFANKSETQYDGDPLMKEAAKRAQDGSYFLPTRSFLDKRLAFIGIVCIALGSLLQW